MSKIFDDVKSSLDGFLSPPTSKQNDPIIKKNADSSAKNCYNNASQNQPFQTNFNSCKKDETLGGEYDLYVGGEKVGTANMVVWTNKDGTKKLVRDDVNHTLEKMREDLKKQTGIDLRINSGFRPIDVQQCMYENYLNCRQEWQNNGKQGNPPSVVGNPAKAGPNSHINGRATDFQTGISPSQIANKSQSQIKKEINEKNFSPTWRWLIENSQTYGWVWTGLSFGEPWHFEFNENLATSKGIYPKK